MAFDRQPRWAEYRGTHRGAHGVTFPLANSNAHEATRTAMMSTEATRTAWHVERTRAVVRRRQRLHPVTRGLLLQFRAGAAPCMCMHNTCRVREACVAMASEGHCPSKRRSQWPRWTCRSAPAHARAKNACVAIRLFGSATSYDFPARNRRST